MTADPVPGTARNHGTRRPLETSDAAVQAVVEAILEQVGEVDPKGGSKVYESTKGDRERGSTHTVPKLGKNEKR